MTKFCPSCKQNKPTADFAKRTSSKDGLQSGCRACQKAWGAARYQLTKKEHYESNKRRRQRNQLAIYNYLLTHPCVDCGIADPMVLTFDHVRGKKLWNISDVAKRSFGLEKIFEEIAKCEVRCFNCHMKKDAPRIGRDKWKALNEASTEGKSLHELPVAPPSPPQHTAST